MERIADELVFTGTVVSGRGEGRYFTRLDWVREQFIVRFGFEPLAGTFNVRVDVRCDADLERLSKLSGIAILPPSAEYCAARCFRARVGPAEGVLVIPEVPDYPRGLLEIVAPLNLRHTIGARDGDRVGVRVYPD